MEDMYVKPGNQERGWNDPPQMSYGLQMARGPQKNLLNKRAALPGVAPPPKTPQASPPSAPPSCGVAPPPTARLAGWMATPPAAARPMKSPGDDDGGQSEGEPYVEGVVQVLQQALAACRREVTPQVCSDVEKRLRLFQDSWTLLSLPVRRRMKSLSLELQAGRWDRADELHRSLMVDHVTEVSQWMVGVKRLIAETRKLSPEALEVLKDSEGPTLDSSQNDMLHS
ncbi:steroid receptor RNA activator 1 [Nerophis ophidion]|uniref:steroid receptor RNA activator 1 n=1 Tax=Nerophis ophidion TaxID=159077 RepID=UPI002ADF4901|nr:steroid receptor RNA activator 1 [Nerophis ophidion]